MTTICIPSDLVFMLKTRPFIVFLYQIFSFREIEKGRCTKNPRVQLVLLQEAKPERAQERPGHNKPAVSLNRMLLHHIIFR